MNAHPLLLNLRAAQEKILVLQGGGDAGKTVAALQYLAELHTQEPRTITTVTGMDMPNIKGGVLRSFQQYVEDDFAPFIQRHNRSENYYLFKNRSILEFKAFADERDARGSERDRLFLNECNLLSYTMAWQLMRKTRRKVLMDYNPTSTFYVHEKILPGPTQDAIFKGRVRRFIIDHRHNPYLKQEDHDAYEAISDPDLHRVYARGLTGKVRGLVFGHFKEWQGADPREEDGWTVLWGIDYGYTTDPTAITKVWLRGRQVVVKELSYAPGLSAREIKDIVLAAGYRVGQEFYSEADPNMVNQLRAIGIAAAPAIKGPGSLEAGISKVREFECFYTSDSTNLKAELLVYKFLTAEDLVTGKEVQINQPVDAWNHCCDSLRYAVYTHSIRHARR